MPKEWYDRAANRITEDMTKEEIARRKFNLRILADKKPYFMRYIYPDLMKDYSTYIKNTDMKCIREFRQTIDELLAKTEDELTPEEAQFLLYYHQRMPVGMHDCVMNKICRRFEEEFDGFVFKDRENTEYDYTIMKNGQGYSKAQYYAVKKLFEEYKKKLQEFSILARKERADNLITRIQRTMLCEGFMTECAQITSNEKQLCDILLDICYQNSTGRQFCWDMCAGEIIDNLLTLNENMIHYPKRDENGNVVFCGEKFSLVATMLEEEDDDNRNCFE